MFTCGPHHADHGLHLLVTGVEAGAFDLLVVAMGLPAGVVWFGLRMEALLGGAGDRHVQGTPRVLALLPVLATVYFAGTMAGVSNLARGFDVPWRAAPNLLVMVLYFFVGATLTATQFRNFEASGRWSVSGLALASIFWTCALMHLVYAGYTTTGQYVDDGHVLAIDVLAVPGAAYFLWLVVGVHRGQIGRNVERPTPAVAATAGV